MYKNYAEWINGVNSNLLAIELIELRNEPYLNQLRKKLCEEAATLNFKKMTATELESFVKLTDALLVIFNKCEQSDASSIKLTDPSLLTLETETNALRSQQRYRAFCGLALMLVGALLLAFTAYLCIASMGLALPFAQPLVAGAGAVIAQGAALVGITTATLMPYAVMGMGVLGLLSSISAFFGGSSLRKTTRFLNSVEKVQDTLKQFKV